MKIKKKMGQSNLLRVLLQGPDREEANEAGGLIPTREPQRKREW